MYVKKIEAKNLRSFENLNIEFSKGINIITGANNSGKSSIIKALYQTQDQTSLKMTDIRTNELEFKVLISISDISIEDRKAMQFVSPDLQNMLLFSSYNKAIESKSVNAINLRDFDNIKLHNIDISDGNLRGNFFKFLGFSRYEDKNNFVYPFFSKRKSPFFSATIGYEPAFAITETFQYLAAKVKKATNHPHTKGRFDDLCKEILGFTIYEIQDGNEEKLGMYSGPGFTNQISIDAMGEGVANIIGLIAMLLTVDGKLFLIEELENDIHPQALKKLLNLIIEKSTNNQFVISTHSNIILKHLGSLKSSKIFFTDVQYDLSKNMFTSSIKEITSQFDRQYALEVLGYDLFDYNLYTAYLILEESSAETIINEVIIPLFYPDLKNKVRTIAAKGAGDVVPKFNDLHRLFLYLHLNEIYVGKAWVIVDGDEAGKKAVAELKDTFKTWNASHFLNFPHEAFELYYPNRFQEEVKKIIKVTDKNNRKKSKEVLLKKVKKWYQENPKEAKIEFKSSAKDVIKYVGEIDRKLKRTSK